MKKQCLYCHSEFTTTKQEVHRGNGKFCSISCSSKFNGEKRKIEKLPNVTCAYCNKKFYKKPSQISCSKSGLFFCCREHKDAAQKIGGIKEIMPSHYGTSLKDYRKIAYSLKPKVCERCGYDNHPAAITVHHKDRNRENNNEENLEVLCYNCHAIEHYG